MHATDLPSTLTQPTDRRPAWLMSVALHLLLLITLAMVVRPTVPAAPVESVRRAAIVLATNSTNDETYYYDDSSTSVTESAAAASAPAANAARSLPAAQATPIPLPGIELPTNAIDASAATGLISVSDGSGRLVERRLAAEDDSAFIASEQAARLAALPRGAKAEVSLFGSKAATGHRFVFLLDRSKSMGSQGLGVMDESGRQLGPRNQQAHGEPSVSGDRLQQHDQVLRSSQTRSSNRRTQDGFRKVFWHDSGFWSNRSRPSHSNWSVLEAGCHIRDDRWRIA